MKLLLSHSILLILAQRARSGWVDPDTETAFHTTVAHNAEDTRDYELVFSDEFETEGRSFADGEDSRWTAIDKNDYTNDALHFYKSENVKTAKGVLQIKTSLEKNNYKAFNEKTKKFYEDTKHVQSGMMQGWNKFCLTGGIVEFSAKLPGKGSVGGLWPALWLLGNLARATYIGSTNWVWPFSNDVCDFSKIHQQEISPCRKVSHYGMEPGVGRGAPEIDILEAMGGEKGKLPNSKVQRPYFSTSLQVAPGVSKNRPIMMKLPKKGRWYEGMEYGNRTVLNPFFYGVTLVHSPKEYTYQSDAISANTQLDESYFQTQNKYRVEWEPPTPGKNDGYVKWYINEEFLFGISGDNLNITTASIPSEPMYLIMNTAVAKSWGFPIPCPEGCDCSCYECGNPDCDCTLPVGYCDLFPAKLEIDYVRVWQAKNEPKHQLSCSTEDRPSELFIKGHKKRYMEEGDKEPLQPLKRGGASCTNDMDCGGEKRGTCTGEGICKCNEFHAGSSCLSHFGFNDEAFSQTDNTLEVSLLLLPGRFIIAFGLLLAGFCSFYIITVIKRTKQSKHDDFETSYLNNNRTSGTYRSMESNEAHSEQTPNSYCFVDGRMIDE